MIHFTEKLDSGQILQLLSKSLPYYLRAWHELDTDRGLFGTTDPQSFNMRDVNSSSPVIEYVLRPHLHILAVLAAYLRSSDSFPPPEPLTRPRMAAMLAQGIRWACDTHLTGTLDIDSFLERKRWGENWRSGVWAAMLATTACLAREDLPDDLKDAIRRVVAFEADRFIDVAPPSGCETDTKLEENAQDVAVLAWALAGAPDHPHASQWEKALRLWALNVATSVRDKADHSEYFGSSVSRSVMTQTVYPDMTAENHGFFHPSILTYGSWIVLGMAAYALNGREEPPFLLRKHHQETFDILLRFCLPTGMLFEPGGQDLPVFIPRPFAFAWGLWNNDPRALRMTARLLSWMDALISTDAASTGQWIPGLEPRHEGWELYFQSQVGFELAMLAVLPFRKEFRLYSTGQIEGAVDTRHIYPYIQVCYRRNTRATRCVAWKAIGGHPTIAINVHALPELVPSCKAHLLGIPAIDRDIRHWEVAFHHDRPIKDGFDSSGRIIYRDVSGATVLRRDIRVVCWGDDGLVVLDQIVAEAGVTLREQYLTPLYLVNDHWTGNKLEFQSGSLREVLKATEKKNREISCPSFWTSIENHLLVQFVWARTRGMVYLPGGERNAPAYWQNCRLDMLAVRVDGGPVAAGEIAYQCGLYLGIGKGPRPFKSAGTAGEFFRGLVIMDGKNTVGLD